jgi:hypothetical protein
MDKKRRWQTSPPLTAAPNRWTLLDNLNLAAHHAQAHSPRQAKRNLDLFGRIQ